jgi:hypothetical protein
MLRIAFRPSGGSWSYGACIDTIIVVFRAHETPVGKANLAINKPNATMNLGWIGKDAQISSDESSVILPEFGHVLGLLHEYVPPDDNQQT